MSFGQYSAGSRGRSNPLREDSKQVVDGKEKRVRQVYPTDEIPHLWAHQTQTSARNQLGNLYFSGKTIYSYGSHFPIATIVENKQRQQAFIVTTAKYSVTTAKQVSHVRQSIPSGAVCFDTVLDSHAIGYAGDVAHAVIVAEYQDAIQRRIAEAASARQKKWTLLLDAYTQRAEMLRYVEFFGLAPMSEKARKAERKIPLIPETLEWVREACAKIQQKQRERREAKEAARQAAYVAKWM